MPNIYHSDKVFGQKINRWEMSCFLTGFVCGFIEGYPDEKHLRRTLRLMCGLELPEDAVKIVKIGSYKEPPWLISAQIDFEGEHYESVYRNFTYYDGMDF